MENSRKNTPVAPSGRTAPDAVEIDPEALDAVLRIGGVELLERLVTVSAANVADRLEQLRAAVADAPPDRSAAERAAHSLKSSAAYLGLRALRAHAEALERDARDGSLDEFPDRIREAERLAAAAQPALADAIRRLRSEP